MWQDFEIKGFVHFMVSSSNHVVANMMITRDLRGR
jgi:hypothetical protein